MYHKIKEILKLQGIQLTVCRIDPFFDEFSTSSTNNECITRLIFSIACLT